MRFIASLMLMVACCVGLSAAQFTDAQVQLIAAKANSLAPGASGTIALAMGDQTITVEVQKGADGSFIVGGAGVPAELRGSYTVFGNAVVFKAAGSNALVFRTIATTFFFDGSFIPFVADGVVAQANAIATALRVGPYSTF